MIIEPDHSSLGPRFTSLSGHRPAMFSGPMTGPPFLALPPAPFGLGQNPSSGFWTPPRLAADGLGEQGAAFGLKPLLPPP